MDVNGARSVAVLVFAAVLSLYGTLTHAQSYEQFPVDEPPAVSDAPAAAPTPLYSFVVLGDDQVTDKSSTNQSTANEYQVMRSFSEIKALTPAPSYVFFNGDLVHGETEHPPRDLQSELDAWVRNLYKPTLGLAPWIKLIPIPGNHELNLNGGHRSLPGAEDVWKNAMDGFLTFAGNGPKAGSLCGNKSLVSNQGKLTYSFDGPAAPLPGNRYDHFVVINTDPQSPKKDSDANSSTVPLDWIKADLKAARNSGRIWRIFAFGHKPLFQPQWMDSCGVVQAKRDCGESSGVCTGLNFYPKMRNDLFNYFNDNQVAVYFTGHMHTWYRSLGKSKHTWQVITGNAGAKLRDWNEDYQGHGYFGFTVVSVRPKGSVMIASYGRDSAQKNAPTTLRDCFCIGESGGVEQACNSKAARQSPQTHR